MTYGFLESTLDTRSADGRNDVLLSELHFCDLDGTLYKVPVGAETNGGDVPWLVQCIPGFQPFGIHWFCWVLHDSGYRGTLKVMRGGQYFSANLSRLASDDLLDRALSIPREIEVVKNGRKQKIKLNMNPAGRKAVWLAVRAGGWRSYHRP